MAMTFEKTVGWLLANWKDVLKGLTLGLAAIGFFVSLKVDNAVVQATQEVQAKALEEVKAGVKGLNSDLEKVKQDVAGVKVDTSGLKSDVSALKVDAANIKIDARITAAKVDRLYDAYIPPTKQEKILGEAWSGEARREGGLVASGN